MRKKKKLMGFERNNKKLRLVSLNELVSAVIDIVFFSFVQVLMSLVLVAFVN